jgi:hypothetical protein
MTIKQILGDAVAATIEHEVDIITDSEWFKTLIQKAVRVELAKMRGEIKSETQNI